jgi:hypothetical protein
MNAERILRAIRRHPGLWGELGPEKERQCVRIIARCKRRMAPKWAERAAALKHERDQRFLWLWD